MSKLLSKPINQSPTQELSSPNTSSFSSFVSRLISRSDYEEKDNIGKLQKDNDIDILKRENLELRKELSKYKNEYTKTHSELKSLEKSAEGLCNCDYYDYVTNSYENIIQEYDKSIEKTQQYEKLVKELLKDIIQANERLEILINRNIILENTCKKSNIPIPSKGMEELDKLVEDIQSSIDNTSQ